MEYNLYKAKFLCDKRHRIYGVVLTYINPSCVFEKSFDVSLFGEYAVNLILGHTPDNISLDEDVPAALISECGIHTIHAEVVEVQLPFPCVYKNSLEKDDRGILHENRAIVNSVFVHCLLTKDDNGNWVRMHGYDPQTLMYQILYKSDTLIPLEKDQ